MAVITLGDLKAALGIEPSYTADDAELIDNIDGAEAEYAEWVRPLPGTYTEPVTLPVFLSHAVTSVSATTADGLSLTVTHNRVTGEVRAGFLAATVVLTYTVGPIPANHRRAIINDVAEYWSRSQRSSAAGRPGFEADSYDAGASRQMSFRPVMTYPRIQALAISVVV